MTMIDGRVERGGIFVIPAFEAGSSFDGLRHLGQVADLGGLQKVLVVEEFKTRRWNKRTRTSSLSENICPTRNRISSMITLG